MPYIQFKDQQFPLGQADLTVGAFDGAGVRLPGDDPKAVAVLMLSADGTGIVRRGAADAIVLLNGVQLGAEPSPILHGDRVELAGHELRYGDDNKSGSTQFLSSANVPDALKAKASSPKKPTTATGGRLVSLVDGREYPVPESGVTFGREIGCDIVISSTEVSRKHAKIAPGEAGYVVADLSTNGVFVNGVRIEKTQTLGRGDVLTIGPEEFRFYADVAKPAPPAASVSAASAPPPVPVPASPAGPSGPLVPAGAGRASITAPASAAKSAPLATLEITNEGPWKGMKFDIFTPLTNIGRGGHNDVSVNDESVSDSHAKILKRDGNWWLVDQESTNGSYIGGQRVQGEQQLAGAPDIRFGGVKMAFRPAAPVLEDEGKGTRAIAGFRVRAARGMIPHSTAGASKAVEPAVEPVVPDVKKKGCAAMIAFLVTLAAVGASTLVVMLISRG